MHMGPDLPPTCTCVAENYTVPAVEASPLNCCEFNPLWLAVHPLKLRLALIPTDLANRIKRRSRESPRDPQRKC